MELTAWYYLTPKKLQDQSTNQFLKLSIFKLLCHGTLPKHCNSGWRRLIGFPSCKDKRLFTHWYMAFACPNILLPEAILVPDAVATLGPGCEHIMWKVKGEMNLVFVIRFRKNSKWPFLWGTSFQVLCQFSDCHLRSWVFTLLQLPPQNGGPPLVAACSWKL